MKDFWNERYAAREYVYGKKPNQYFKKNIDGLTAGNILLPCEGEGRNAVYAAQKGWDVEAIDFSVEGKKKALSLAFEHHVSITYKLQDIRNLNHTLKNKYQCIGLFYCHMGQQDRYNFHRQIKKYLLEDGIIILEAFSKEQPYFGTGGPGNPDLLFNTEMLRSDFSDFQLIELYQSNEILKEGPYHQGLSSVVRMVAQKRFD